MSTQNLPPRAMIHCYLCETCRQYVTAIAGPSCATCVQKASAREIIDTIRENRDTWKASAEKAEGEIAAIIDKYGDPEESETLEQVVEAVWKNGDQGWGEAGRMMEQRDAANALVGELREVVKRLMGDCYIPALRELARLDGQPRIYTLRISDMDAFELDALLTRTPTEALEALKERLRREGAVEALQGLSKVKIGGDYRPHVSWRTIEALIAAFQAQPVSNPYKLGNHPDAPESSEEGR